jgi:hypothetical protein
MLITIVTDIACPVNDSSIKIEQGSSGAMRINSIKVVRILSAIVILLVSAHLAGQSLKFVGGPDLLRNWHITALVEKLDLNSENNIPTWYQSVSLLLCALLLSVVAHHSNGPGAYRRWLWHWRGLALIFVILSMDEMASLHEVVGTVISTRHQFSGLLYYAWVIPGVSLLAIFAAGYAAFVWHLPGRERVRFVTAGTIYVAGAIGVEMLGAAYISQFGEQHITCLEETMEMVGILLFVRALLQYIEDLTGRVAVDFEPASIPVHDLQP